VSGTITTTPPAVPAPGSGLLAKLMATVRAEFRVEVFTPALGELVFSSDTCLVPDCLRQPRTRRLCRGHYYRWGKLGRPDIEAFLADPGPEPAGRGRLRSCAAAECRHGAARQGLCVSHHGIFERAGKPDRAAWLAGLPRVVDDEHPVCRLSFCDLWTQGSSPLCLNHKSRWYLAGQPDLDEFVRRCETSGDDRFDLRVLGEKPQLRMELAYALQCRHDERKVNTRSSSVTPVVRLVAASGVSSLLDWPIERWSGYFTSQVGSSHDQNGQMAFLRYAHGRLEDLATGDGWRVSFRATCGCCADSASKAQVPGSGSIGSASRGCGTWPSGSSVGG